MHPIARNIILNHIRPLSQRPSTKGRPRAFCIEYLLERIEFVLRTGIQWSNLPVEGGNWKTVYHHFAKWSKANVFEHAFKDLVSFYLKRRSAKHLIVDTSFVKNVFGRDCVGRSPVDRGRRATKVSALVDDIGTPLHILFHPGNKSDCRTLDHLFAKSSNHIDLAGHHLLADKGYDVDYSVCQPQGALLGGGGDRSIDDCTDNIGRLDEILSAPGRVFQKVR